MIRHILLVCLVFFASKALAQETEKFATSTEYIIKKGETIYKVALDYDLGIEEIVRANPSLTDLRRIRIGKKIILPTTHLLPNAAHKGIVINISEPRLYFFTNDQIASFPISVGTEAKTPTGRTKISQKIENPSWTPPASIREENPDLPDVVPPGPNNPLGQYAFRLNATKNRKWQSIMIHGTNEPWRVGGKVSHGCIRLYPQDVETLFTQVEVDTPVLIVDQPIKVQEFNGEIYIEVTFQNMPEDPSKNLGAKALVCKRVKNCEARIDWDKVHDAVAQNRGIPVKVSIDEVESENN